MTDSATKTRPVTILLVDDDDVDAMGVERALKKLKIPNTTVRARDGFEALEFLRTPDVVDRPFIVLLDLNMPRMNGIEMLIELRDDPALTSSVVFILTTSEDEKDKFLAYQEHVAGYMVKNKLGDGFMSAINMLSHYWRVVELPVAPD